MVNPLIYESAKDLRYLLSRGYNRSSAIKFVGDKYQLDKVERHILFRGVFPHDFVERTIEKLISVKELENKSLAIDGFNLIITVEAILKNSVLILCDDGFIRDISAVFEKFRADETTFKALNLIFELLIQYPPREIFFLLDSPISNSGKLANVINNYFKKYQLKGEALTSKNVDREVLNSEVVASSDHLIIDKAKRVVDIPKNFLNKFKGTLIEFKE